MNTKINHRKVLEAEIRKIENLPGNWDEKGASRASARACGKYKGFLDIVPEHKLEYMPKLRTDGSILVKWKGYLKNTPVIFVVHFLVNGKIKIGFVQTNDRMEVEVEDKLTILPVEEESDRLRDFVYAAS